MNNGRYKNVTTKGCQPRVFGAQENSKMTTKKDLKDHVFYI